MKNTDSATEKKETWRLESCPGRSIYLDNASTTFPKPEEVYRFMDEFFRTFGVNPGRSSGCAFSRAGNLIQVVRERLTRFFNGQNPERLIFTSNCTDSLNLALNGLLKPGDHVITTNLEHNSVLRPLRHLQRDRQIEVDAIPFDEGGYIDPQQIGAHLRKNTRLVVVTHGSNVLGTIQPVAEIGAWCRKHGVLFLVDSAQTAGAIPIDIEAMNIDLLAFTGHKSLLGPMGIGGLYVGEGIDIQPTRFGGTGILSAEPFQPEAFPYRLESGTVNMVGVAGLYAALDYLERRGIGTIFEHEMALYRQLSRGLAAMPGITLHSDWQSDLHLPLISISVQRWEAVAVGDRLADEFGIYTRCGLHCSPKVHEQGGTAPGGTIRLAIGPMTTADEIDLALEALKKISGGDGDRA